MLMVESPCPDHTRSVNRHNTIKLIFMLCIYTTISSQIHKCSCLHEVSSVQCIYLYMVKELELCIPDSPATKGSQQVCSASWCTVHIGIN